MKKRSLWNTVYDLLVGRGFYMVMLLCVLAMVGSGYYLYRLATQELESASAPAVVQTQPESASEETAVPIAPPMPESQIQEAMPEPESEPVVLPEQEPAEQTAAEPEPVAEETVLPVEEPAEETVATAEPAPAEESRLTACWPVSGDVVAAFSATELTYNGALGDWRTHGGVDLSAEEGEEVLSVLDGQVLAIEQDFLLGTTVRVNHGGGLMSVYANLSEEVPVEQGELVKAGQVLGTVGTTAAGEEHEGCWLHFAMEQDGAAVDPQSVLNP